MSDYYDPASCAVIYRTRETWGELSNMASGFPLVVGPHTFLSSEHLYQCARFPHLPEVQTAIMAGHSGMSAKMKSKPRRSETRADWDEVRVPVMAWVLGVKFAQHPVLRRLLLSSGERQIVEKSLKDPFWGAKPSEDGLLFGENTLGRLLMAYRDGLRADPDGFWREVVNPGIPDFIFCGTPAPVIEGRP